VIAAYTRQVGQHMCKLTNFANNIYVAVAQAPVASLDNASPFAWGFLACAGWLGALLLWRALGMFRVNGSSKLSNGSVTQPVVTGICPASGYAPSLLLVLGIFCRAACIGC
jgi:hypothetical protein